MWKKKIIGLYREDKTANVFDNERGQYAYQKYKHKVEAKVLKKSIAEFPENSIKILDVACGTGRMVPEVFSINKKISYTGLDTSKSMTKFLKEKAAFLKKEKDISLVYADATKMPFKDNTFDITYTYHLLWHLPKQDQQKIIKEMIRVTKKNGIIILDILNKNFIFDRIKNIFGAKERQGLYKLSVKEVESIIQGKSYKKVDLLDIPIKNVFVYSIFNIINKLNQFFPTDFFHMLYFKIKK